MPRKVWTAEQLAAFNKRQDGSAPKSEQGEAHGDGGADAPQAGDACTTEDGRSGYIFAGGDRMECRADGET